MDVTQIISSLGLILWPFLVLMFIIPVFSRNPLYQTIVFWIVALFLLAHILFLQKDTSPITRIFMAKPKIPPPTEEEKKMLEQVQLQTLQITFDDALRLTFALMMVGLLYRVFAIWIDVLPSTVSKVRRIKEEKAKENIQDLVQFLRLKK